MLLKIVTRFYFCSVLLRGAKLHASNGSNLGTSICEALLNPTFKMIFRCRELLGLRIVTNLLMKTTAIVPQVSVCVCTCVCERERDIERA